ncbi:MAG: DinB family protein [Candidatus Eiseniibacteriota bacterium]
MPATLATARPAADEHVPYFSRYIDRVPGHDPLAALASQIEETTALVLAAGEAKAGYRYAPDKWTVRDVIGHLMDSERVFAYRALRFGRGDETPVPGFDENIYVPGGNFNRRTLADVVAEFRAVRAATLALFKGLEDDAWGRRGVASGNPVSVRALAWIAAGHELHHVAVLRERYGLAG